MEVEIGLLCGIDVMDVTPLIVTVAVHHSVGGRWGDRDVTPRRGRRFSECMLVGMTLSRVGIVVVVDGEGGDEGKGT